MADLTAAEIKWVKRVQRALDACPSDRIGFATTGDANVTLHDRTKENKIHAVMNRRGCDFCQAVDEQNADFFLTLNFPSNVHSVAG